MKTTDKEVMDYINKNKDKIRLGFKLKNPNLIPIISSLETKKTKKTISRKQLDYLIEKLLEDFDYSIDRLDNILISDSNTNPLVLKQNTLETLKDIKYFIDKTIKEINRKEG